MAKTQPNPPKPVYHDVCQRAHACCSIDVFEVAGGFKGHYTIEWFPKPDEKLLNVSREAGLAKCANASLKGAFDRAVMDAVEFVNRIRLDHLTDEQLSKNLELREALREFKFHEADTPAAETPKPKGKNAMAKKRPPVKTSDVTELKQQLATYEEIFHEIQHFTGLISEQQADLEKAQAEVSVAKAAYDEALSRLKEMKESRDGTKHALFVYLQPQKILPLFDRMEPANEKTHGRNAKIWRKEPVTALRLSLPATTMLTAAEILLVGQLQDRIGERPDDWWDAIEGMTAAIAAAIADKLEAFIRDWKD